MKNKIEAIIFDMDGTLYTFDKGEASVFTKSKFGAQIHDNCIKFFETKFNLSKKDAEVMYLDLKNRYQGEVSLAVEKELGINRLEYFATTWDLDPGEFMETNQELIVAIASLNIKSGILSAAPKIWVDRVLKFLDINQFFEPAIFTGDPDLRKPDPLAFQQLATFWELAPQSILAVGDQEETDILPAKSLGMMTARVGKDLTTVADFTADNIISLLNDLRQKDLL